ncbi:GAF domain-containing sensor histidine kinase [Paractinoplanes lichenicola]|uniref:Sensor-like histidine kinase SenX3 n=1 Tax=Paractinoplanes lichenicola TaxID=2802976 RepID=A0ABS1VQ96_9ACTN|nr:GAF domain-containing sensor histidine kinase [Actinoplanes lichenicola]MBL7255706.1 GAF domain-containing sensor histidine kinase [Actinoplanes lichenicola]
MPEVLELVADVCQAPMVALKVADEAHAHFAATLGMPMAVDVPKSRSLCDIVAGRNDTMVVDDASHDPRLADHPLVSGAAHVNFIAAAPLRHDGHIVGALCVFDNGRRSLDADTTRRYLERLARRVDAETGLRHLLDNRSPLELAGREDMLATMSHEFRTPLTAIQGYVELLNGVPGAVPPAFARQLDAISRNAGRLCRTVDTLLRAAHQHHVEPVGDRRTVDLTCLTARVAEALGPAASRIVLDGPGRPVPVYADPQLLEVAIGHLLSNALGYSRADHPVVVSLAGGPRPVLEIRDFGPGLGEQELTQLGLPFFRGADAQRNESPGMGLGLAVTRRIIAAQGADLTFASPFDGGLAARIVFG